MPKDHNLPRGEASPVRVFVSYSRSDHAFALDLVAGLEACGFEPYFDQEDIAPGEPWQARLSGLIEAADTVVFVISPDSLRSEHCNWEVEATLDLSKRLLPVMWRSVPDADLPDKLAALNFIPFQDGQFANGLRALANALRVDVDWVREHTRIGALARRWEQRGRSDAMLLRGEELEAAAAWAAAKPSGAPEITNAQLDFVGASKAAADAAERAARNRRLGLIAGLAAVAVALAGLSYYGLDQAAEARAAEQEVFGALQELRSTTTALQAADIRLNADIGLKIPPREVALSVDGRWFPIAAAYSGAIVRIEAFTASGQQQVTTGLIVDGAMIHPDLAHERLLLAGRVFGEAEARAMSRVFTGPPPAGETGEPPIMEQRFISEVPGELADAMVEERGAEMTLSFPIVPEGDRVRIDPDPVWQTAPELEAMTKFSLYRLSDPLPLGMRAIGEADVDCDYVIGVEALPARPEVALIGVDEAGTGTLTLEVTELVDASNPFEIYYNHTPMPGTFGAPVFSLESGRIVALHTDAERTDPGGLVEAYGFSLGFLINEIRDQVSIDRGDGSSGRTPPLCWWE